MKKYLITEADLNYLVVNSFYPLPAKAIAESLKPIESLSDEQVHQVLREADAVSVEALDYRTIRGQPLTLAEKLELDFDMRVCRAIEKRIVGETP